MGLKAHRPMSLKPLAVFRRVIMDRMQRSEQKLAIIDFSISPSLSNALDILRSAAALLVVLNHLGEGLFLFDKDLDLFNLFVFQILYLGHHSVMVLFVVSGFLIGRSAIQSVSLGGGKVFDYAIDRGARIYVVLIPALLIGFVSDQILIYVAAGPEFDYISSRLGLFVFLGNLFGLQTIFVPTFGSNGPLWSLACELWYYFMCPAFLIMLFGKSMRSRLLAMMGLITALGIASDEILLYAPIWCLGVLCWLPGRSLIPKWLAWSILGGFLSSANNEYLWAHGWGYLHIAGTALAVALILNCHRHDRSSRVLKRSAISSFFAKFTYSVYLYHYPPLMVILALILKDQFVPFDHFGLHEASATMGLLLFLYAYSYALFWLTERNYRPLRDCLRAKIPRFKLD